MMKKTASYIPNKMKVVGIKALSPDVKSVRLEFAQKSDAKNFSFEPGQFIILSLAGYGEAILAVTSTMDEMPEIELAIRSEGNSTKAIHRLEKGDIVGLRGPYGNSFPFQQLYGKEVLLIGGGTGLVPLRSFIKLAKDDKYLISKLKVFHGAKSPDNILFKADFTSWKKFAEVFIAVNEADSDWKGHVGHVTELFEQTKIDKDSIAIICGPEKMYLPTIKLLKKKGLVDENIYVMLERRMKCGIGKCQHCTCGDKYVCMDGPIFKYSELKDNWEAFK